MQASRPPYNDSVDYHSYFPQKTNLYPPASSTPSTSPSQFPAPQTDLPTARLPRTSPYLPSSHLGGSSNHGGLTASQGLSAAGHYADRTEATASPAEPYGATSIGAGPQSPTYNNTTFVNRWSASTGSSRSNSALGSRTSAARTGRRKSSVDTTFLLTSSPASPKQTTRKLQKTRNPSASSKHTPTGNFIADESPVASNLNRQPYIGLPTLNPLSPLENSFQNHPYPGADTQEATEGATLNYQQQPSTFASRDISDPRFAAARDTSDTMPYDQPPQSYAPHGHARNRSGKSSSDSAKARGSKQPSQKATLSRALQKANTAVQLDNDQNFSGARQAYAEACELLQQVLQRTSAPEDKRKLEAIRRTYTSRIDELDQMLPWHLEAKRLPDSPDNQSLRRQSILRRDYGQDEEPAVVETATVTALVTDDAYSPHPSANTAQPWSRDTHRVASPQENLRPPLPVHSSEPGFLQSSFSRSPVRLRFPENALQTPADSAKLSHAPSAPQHQPQENHYEDNLDGPVRSDFSVATEHREEPRGEIRRGLEHVREDSQNSWLDPIDESGGSTASSVHSRTSSLGYRRRHIRAGSGDTEAEFDTALDAAIEAAYDEGYEPMGADDVEPTNGEDDIVANALRRVELARERVRQTEREAYEMASERERERFRLQPQQYSSQGYDGTQGREGFFDDNSSDEEERMLEEMTRDYSLSESVGREKQRSQTSIPRESDSSGLTSRTWNSSMGSNPPGTGITTLSTVTEATAPPPMSKPSLAPAAPPPTQALPDLPVQRPPSANQTVRNRRMSGQNHKQLKIETSGFSPPIPSGADEPSQSKPMPLAEQEITTSGMDAPRPFAPPRRPSSPGIDPSPADLRPLGSPFGHRPPPDSEDVSVGRSASPSVNKLKKNFSSSSLRSLKNRNMSVSNLDEATEMSPGTPSSSQWGSSRPPAIPALPSSMAANLRERAETSTGGMYLLDDSFHLPETPGSPNTAAPDAPVPLEPCPTDFMLRPFWLMRCLYQTLVHPRGGYLSSKLFVPRDAWRVKGVKLKNVEDKIANCDFLTAALLKLARVDTCDADAMLEEMQSMEGVLEQIQASLSRKLGNEVGVQSMGALFKDAPGGADGDAPSSLPRSASVSQKSSFSWRRLRSKNSAAALSAQTRAGGGVDASKDISNVSTLPMTTQPTSKPARRDMSQAQFTGPNSHYMGSLARLFDAAQVIDQIARQVEDPGLRHADKTQVGLELCTRHAAEFFGFYICRFVLADLGMLMDKFIKRSSEWVLA